MRMAWREDPLRSLRAVMAAITMSRYGGCDWAADLTAFFGLAAAGEEAAAAGLAGEAAFSAFLGAAAFLAAGALAAFLGLAAGAAAGEAAAAAGCSATVSATLVSSAILRFE